MLKSLNEGLAGMARAELGIAGSSRAVLRRSKFMLSRFSSVAMVRVGVGVGWRQVGGEGGKGLTLQWREGI